ncbi:LPS glycosyltransferase [Penicillium alfredii]|uniref:LPS glycosyltransferase n=1 Tax=Penicillium alfredii TaxID=1506179 RepID=A0A9W9EN10_9EURO|nr:LPS glycosyltransferase [Penicillium alfredii]KAJ5084852.1 LPS glycosyltransferase [Penicillium alfredii]
MVPLADAPRRVKVFVAVTASILILLVVLLWQDSDDATPVWVTKNKPGPSSPSAPADHHASVPSTSSTPSKDSKTSAAGSSKDTHSNPNPASPGVKAKDPLHDIGNSTLGFERIFAIGFSNRMDKRDAVTVGASIAGLDLEWMEGVRAADIPEKGYPEGWDTNIRNENEIGCWRAHMNAIQRIVQEKRSSAMIVEDDVDWEAHFRGLSRHFATGARALQGSAEETRSPYGDDWDLLWTGGCAMRTIKPTFYVTYNETTVRPVEHRKDIWWPKISEEPEYEGARFVFDGAVGDCTPSYALSYQGARKILTYISMGTTTNTIDIALARLCAGKLDVPFRCLGAYPTIFSSFWRAGSGMRDSELRDGDPAWHPATSAVAYSTMINAGRLINGSTTALAQWPEMNPQEIPLDYEPPSGEIVTVDELPEEDRTEDDFP